MQKFNEHVYQGILLACMPKSGSSSTANMIASFPQIRITDLVPGFDIREQEIDLHLLEAALRDNVDRSFVAQHHICLSNTTRYLLDNKHLTPVVTTRNLPDALVSLVDHYQTVDNSRENFLLPARFNEYALSRRIDYVIHFQAPWYLKFFKSWLRYDRFREVWLRYEDLATSNLHYLEQLSVVLKMNACDNSLYAAAQAGQLIGNRRFNKGLTGRGQELMTPAQLGMIASLIELAEIPEEYHQYLLHGTGFEEAARQTSEAA